MLNFFTMRSSKSGEMEEWDMACSSLFVDVEGLGGVLARYLSSSHMTSVLKDCFGGCMLVGGVDEWYCCHSHESLGCEMDPMCLPVGECMCASALLMWIVVLMWGRISLSGLVSSVCICK